MRNIIKNLPRLFVVAQSRFVVHNQLAFPVHNRFVLHTRAVAVAVAKYIKKYG